MLAVMFPTSSLLGLYRAGLTAPEQVADQPLFHPIFAEVEAVDRADRAALALIERILL